MAFPPNLTPFSPRALQILARSTISRDLELLVTSRVEGVQLSCEGPVLAIDPGRANLFDLLVAARLVKLDVQRELVPPAEFLSKARTRQAVTQATSEVIRDFPQLRALLPGLPASAYQISRRRLELAKGPAPLVGDTFGLFGVEVSGAEGDERATEEYIRSGAYPIVHDRTLGLGVASFDHRHRIGCVTPHRLGVIKDQKRVMVERVATLTRCFFQRALESLATSAEIEYANAGVFLDPKRLHLAYLGGVTGQRFATFRRRVHDRRQYSPERHLMLVGFDRAELRTPFAAPLSEMGLCLVGWAMERLGARAVVLGFENSFVEHTEHGPLLIHRTHQYKSRDESFEDPAVVSRVFDIPHRAGCVNVPHLDFDSLWRCAQDELESGEYDLVTVYYWPSEAKRAWSAAARPRDDSVAATKAAAGAARSWERPKVNVQIFGVDEDDT